MEFAPMPPLAPLLSHIISTYYVHLYSTIIIYDQPTTPLMDSYLDSIHHAMATGSNSSSSHRLIVHWVRHSQSLSDNEYLDLILLNVELGSQGFITLTSDLERFLRIKSEIQTMSHQRKRDLVFLFLCDTFDAALMEHPAFDLYPNHLLIAPDSTEPTSDGEIATVYNMWTQQFVGAQGYERHNAVLVDTYNSTSKLPPVRPLFTDKIKNLMGRPLRFSTINYVPYTFTEFVSSGMGQIDHINGTEPKTLVFDGTEARLLQAFCRLRNCTLKMMPFESDDWGGIYNGTGVGMLGALYDGEVEFIIGSIYNWYFDIFDFSQTLAKSAITLLVPAALPLSYALTPILPFDSSTWLSLFITMHISVVLYYAIKMASELLSHKDTVARLSDVDRSAFKTSIRTTYLEVIAVFLQQSFNQGTSRIAVRTVYCVLLISGITLENAYSGGLKAALTIPRYHDKIETVHQFVQTGYHWGAPQPAWVFSIRHAKVPDDLAMYERFEAHSDEVLRNKSFDRNYGIGIERLHGGSYQFSDFVQIDALKQQEMLREDVYYEYTIAYGVRGWPLMAYFDKITREVSQHGLLNRWETEIVKAQLNVTTENYLKQLAVGYSETAGPEVLRVVHIYGPMVMLAIGVVAASMAFVGEHAYYRAQVKKKLKANEDVE